jgi:hypothetical protein
MCAVGFLHLCMLYCLVRGGGGGGVILGVTTEVIVEQYLFFPMLYSQYQWWGGKVCSNGHGGWERGCYMRGWPLPNISVLQSVVLFITWVKIVVNACGS